MADELQQVSDKHSPLDDESLKDAALTPQDADKSLQASEETL